MSYKWPVMSSLKVRAFIRTLDALKIADWWECRNIRAELMWKEA
jgi:hypothetical protein